MSYLNVYWQIKYFPSKFYLEILRYSLFEQGTGIGIPWLKINNFNSLFCKIVLQYTIYSATILSPDKTALGYVGVKSRITSTQLYNLLWKQVIPRLHFWISSQIKEKYFKRYLSKTSGFKKTGPLQIKPPKQCLKNKLFSLAHRICMITEYDSIK